MRAVLAAAALAATLASASRVRPLRTPQHAAAMGAANGTSLEVCDRDTGSHCVGGLFPCSSALGPTVCSEHRCVCQEGYCAAGGRCYEAESAAVFKNCDPGPVGSCLFGDCITGRNAECVHGQCMCRKNFCARSLGHFMGGGVCEMPATTWQAEVAEIDADHPRFPPPHNSVDLAVCMSGGGARAASMTVGVLRALEDLDLMGHVDAISSVSGSLFSSIPYMFHNKTIMVDGKEVPLWGEGKEPEELTLQELDYNTSPLSTQFADGWGGTWGTVTKGVPSLLKCIAESRHHQSPCWRRVMREQFLDSLGLGDQDCLMAGSDEDEAEIQRRNPLLKTFCFQKPKKGRPKVFVIGAALLALAGENKQDAVSFQISPDFSGTPFHVRMQSPGYSAVGPDAELSESVVGGGMIQTFAVDSGAPVDQTGGNCSGTGRRCLREVRSPVKPFTLAEAMAMATYADFLSALPKGDWTPVGDYWPIGDGKQPARKFMVGDAGFIEDTGLLPMLQRKAKRVVMMLFVGPGQELNTTVDWCGLGQDAEFDPSSFKAAGQICDSLYTIFGYGYDDGQWHKSHNTVFRQREMFEVACELKKLKEAGKPLVYTRKHQVVPNHYWGIKEYTVDVLYAYNDRVPEFEKRLPEETRQSLENDMKGFPTDLPAGLYMKPRIIKLMASQFEYNIKQNANMFRKFFQRK